MHHVRPWSSLLSLAVILASCGSTPPRPTSPSPDAGGSSSPQASLPIASAAAASGAPCPVTSFETIPANDVVGWDQPTWQRATTGVWAHPYLPEYTIRSGFQGSESGVKILWWILDAGNDTVILDVTSFPAGAYSAGYAFDTPGPDRRDRPTSFTTPPPGCYEIRIAVGSRSGAILDQVLP
jgi:hypothetical protein